MFTAQLSRSSDALKFDGEHNRLATPIYYTYEYYLPLLRSSPLLQPNLFCVVGKMSRVTDSAQTVYCIISRLSPPGQLVDVGRLLRLRQHNKI